MLDKLQKLFLFIQVQKKRFMLLHWVPMARWEPYYMRVKLSKNCTVIKTINSTIKCKQVKYLIPFLGLFGAGLYIPFMCINNDLLHRVRLTQNLNQCLIHDANIQAVEKLRNCTFMSNILVVFSKILNDAIFIQVNCTFLFSPVSMAAQRNLAYIT